MEEQLPQQDLKHTNRLVRDADLSLDEDLALGVMNLISAEEHLFFTYAKTEKEVYLELLKVVREKRKDALKKLIGSPEGELWCVGKHLLAASMRFEEVGTKELSNGDLKEAARMFRTSFELFSTFLGIQNWLGGDERGK